MSSARKFYTMQRKLQFFFYCNRNNATWKVAIKKQMRIFFVSGYLLRRSELTNLVIDAASFFFIYHDGMHNSSMVLYVYWANTWVVLLKIEIMKDTKIKSFYMSWRNHFSDDWNIHCSKLVLRMVYYSWG